MARIAGIEIPNQKKINIALTYIYGINRTQAGRILKTANIDNKKVKDLTQEEINRIQQALEPYKLEGDLKREVADNIQRLKALGTYRGLRHKQNLPARGQRTKSNARTKRGKRKTVGAISKKIAQRMGLDTSKK